MTHLQFARLAFKGSATIESALQLSGSRASSYTGWISQAKAFYWTALKKENIQTGLAFFGINPTRVW
jgi:hypothetical protein